MTHRRAASLTLAFAAVSLTAAWSGEAPKLAPGQTLDLEHGREIYRSSCARCHDTGQGGAPRLQEGQAWAGRSVQWFSVVKEHASKGFLKMPPKGQKPILTDQDIADAVFYMLEERN